MTTKVVSGAWLCLMLLAPRLALAEDARLPYQYIRRVQQAQVELGHAHTNLLFVMQLRCTLTNVNNSNITVFIDAKSGRIPVPLGAEGVFSVPVRTDLSAENPWIIINQPKGTMELNWHAGLAPALVRQMKTTNAIHYRPLMLAVRDCDEAQDAMRQLFPAAPRLTLVGLRLTFRASAMAPSAIIHAKGGDRRLAADVLNELIIPLDGDLLEEDPLMTLTESPVAVEIILRKSESGP
jgi:hypothetical protein